MASGYLGEFEVDLATTEYKDFKPADWAMAYIERYGQIDGDHHKAWVLDQVARILKGTPVLVKEARWHPEGGEITTEYRFKTGEPSAAYEAWVQEMLGEEDDGEHEYDYDVGIPP